MQHVHHGILKGIREKGFCSDRPQVGICIKYESPEGKKRLLEHNKRFASPLLPPVDETAEYGSLACTHLTLAAKCVKSNLKSPIGELSKLLNEDDGFKEFVDEGHLWIILPGSLIK